MKMRLRLLGFGIMAVFALGVVPGCGGEEPGIPVEAGQGDVTQVQVFVAEGRVHSAAVSSEGGGQAVFVDGQQVGDRYDLITGLATSPDGKTSVFAARLGEKAFVVKNGKRLGEYKSVGDPVLSPDGTRVAFVTQDGTNSYVTVDDQPASEVYDGDIGQPVFGPDGRSIAYPVMQRKSGKSFVMHGHQRIGDEYDTVAQLKVTPDRASLVFVAHNGTESFLVKDGSPWGPSYNIGPDGSIYGLTFSPDGKSVAFVVFSVSERYVVKDFERVSDQFEPAGGLVLGPSGNPIVFPSRQGKEWFLVWNGERRDLPSTADAIRYLVLDSTGTRAACWVRRGGRWYVNKAGVDVFGPADQPIALTGCGSGEIVAIGQFKGQIRRTVSTW